MAERVLSVRLVAMVDQYRKAMKDAAGVTDGVTTSAQRMTQVGDRMSSIGGTLTRNVTLPIVALGGAATVMAGNFDNAFTRMQTLAGVSAGEVDGLKDSVLGLAGQTGKAPQELAEALYFLRSSGLSSADAMDALTMSAKASATGLGSTVQVADAVSSAMNAYAKSGLSAAEATDVMVATARAGKAEPAELAAQMGRVLPVAAELGVTFQDVGAAIASLSLAGNDAATSTTQLTNLLSKILKPSQQAEEALAAVGLSTGDLRQMIAEDGLLGTLEALRERLGDSGFTKFLEDQQAVLAGLALTGQNVERNREIFGQLADSAGTADKAFSTWAESMGAENARAWGEMQAAMVEFGDQIAPIVAGLLGLVAGIAKGFSDLPEGAQKAIVVFLALTAALGPVLSGVGNVMKVVGAMQTAFSSAMSAVGGFEGGMSRLGRTAAFVGGPTALLAAGVALEMWNEAEKRSNTERLTNEFLAAGKSAEAMAEVMKSALDKGPTEFVGIFDTLARTNREAAERFVDVIAEAEGETSPLVENMRHHLETLAGAEAQTAEDTEAVSAAMDTQAESTEAATDALKEHLDTLRAQVDPLFGMVDAIRGVRDAQISVAEAEAALNEARASGTADEAAAAERDYTDALDDANKSSADLQFAAAELKGAMLTQGLSVEDATAMLVNWAMQAGFTEDQAYQMAASMGFASSEAQRLDGISIDVGITSNVAAVGGELEQLRQKWDGRQLSVHVQAAFDTKGSIGVGGGLKFQALGGPVYRGEGYVVGEKGPEWFEPNADGRIIPNHMLGSYMSAGPSSSMTNGSGGGWGGTTVNEFHAHFHGPVASQSDADRWVATAFNRAAEQGMVNVRGRRL